MTKQRERKGQSESQWTVYLIFYFFKSCKDARGGAMKDIFKWQTMKQKKTVRPNAKMWVDGLFSSASVLMMVCHKSSIVICQISQCDRKRRWAYPCRSYLSTLRQFVVVIFFFFFKSRLLLLASENVELYEINRHGGEESYAGSFRHLLRSTCLDKV